MSVGDAPLLIALVGPSGSGKSTLAARVVAEHADFHLSVSYTTRAPRPGERDGREYHFVTREVFDQRVRDGLFLEWADVHGNRYGTPREPVAVVRVSRGSVVFDVDYQGTRQIRASLPELVAVFVLPPSMAELERRLRARATDRDEVIARRLDKARAEIEAYPVCDYVLVNDVLETSYDQLRCIIVAERARRSRCALHVEALLAAGRSAPQDR